MYHQYGIMSCIILLLLAQNGRCAIAYRYLEVPDSKLKIALPANSVILSMDDNVLNVDVCGLKMNLLLLKFNNDDDADMFYNNVGTDANKITTINNGKVKYFYRNTENDNKYLLLTYYLKNRCVISIKSTVTGKSIAGRESIILFSIYRFIL